MPSKATATRTRTKYDEKTLAGLYIQLQSNDGNVLKTSRELAIPQQTVRDYKRKWEAEGPPDSIREAAVELAGVFEDDAERVRDLALRELERQIRTGEAKAAQLIAVVDKLTDKIRVIRGLATERTEHVHKVDPGEIATQVAGLVTDALSQTAQRFEEIEIAEVVEEQDVLSLPAPGPIEEETLGLH